MIIKKSHRIKTIISVLSLVLIGALVFVWFMASSGAENSINSSKKSVTVAMTNLNSKENIDVEDIKDLQASFNLELDKLCQNFSLSRSTECGESRKSLEDMVEKTGSLVRVIEYQGQIAELLPAFNKDHSYIDNYNDWQNATNLVQALSTDKVLEPVKATLIAGMSEYAASWKLLASADTNHNVDHFNKAKQALDESYVRLDKINDELESTISAINASLAETIDRYINS